MMRLLCTQALLLLTTFVYCQKSTLLQNINIEASELEHSLNSTGDSLILKGKRSIDKVEIFNGTFEKMFVVQNQAVKIPLSEIPVGRFVTEVKLKDKLIIITLLRHEVINESQKLTAIDNSKTLVKKTFTNNGQENMAQIEIVNAANGKQEKPSNSKIRKSYWIIKMINNGHSSRKVMKFADESEVTKMIEQHDLDLRTKSGKSNELTVWEVYDTTQFLKYKRINPDYTETIVEADCFNSLPFYKSINPARAL